MNSEDSRDDGRDLTWRRSESKQTPYNSAKYNRQITETKETLEYFIDSYYLGLLTMPQPKKKQPRREDSAESEDNITTSIEVCVLESINNKLAILELLHQDIKDLKASLEFSQTQIESIQNENKELQNKITTITTQLVQITEENKFMKETILDLQCRSMRDNLIFSGIPEQAQDNPEKTIKDFMH